MTASFPFQLLRTRPLCRAATPVNQRTCSLGVRREHPHWCRSDPPLSRPGDPLHTSPANSRPPPGHPPQVPTSTQPATTPPQTQTPHGQQPRGACVRYYQREWLRSGVVKANFGRESAKITSARFSDTTVRVAWVDVDAPNRRTPSARSLSASSKSAAEARALLSNCNSRRESAGRRRRAG